MLSLRNSICWVFFFVFFKYLFYLLVTVSHISCVEPFGVAALSGSGIDDDKGHLLSLRRHEEEEDVPLKLYSSLPALRRCSSLLTLFNRRGLTRLRTDPMNTNDSDMTYNGSGFLLLFLSSTYT